MADILQKGVKDGKTDLTLLIEMKAKEMRGAEKRVVQSQERLFKNIPNVQWELVQEASKINEILEKL